MNISTKFFGEIEIDKNSILSFESGIPGFEEYKQYAIIDVEDRKFKCLQSIDEKDVCLIIISPWDYFESYEFNISDSEVNELGIIESNQALVFNIVTVRENNVTANLIAPIVINILNNKARQIVLCNSNYSVREGIECLF
ncbi:flagellar assembly protein FliW [Clostridium cylindrosporum]|uniref:Flagellar assembly factor FliW n=1 Tax=Clostridium cylindrosporum DSM 605 TaxID=1121307 RepID=A0A0J8DBJ9_CLOCY|nr:flagellar assembly protein FliW [Clostridium cylindrosporum]KMT21689.1 flagellar assembly factor FliW [Clostridium cylindrosporum DSM 605]